MSSVPVVVDQTKPVCAGCGAVNVAADGDRCANCSESVAAADAERAKQKAAAKTEPLERFKLLAYGSHAGLINAVNIYLAEGWELHGVTFSTQAEHGGIDFLQAVTRSKEAAEEAARG